MRCGVFVWAAHAQLRAPSARLSVHLPAFGFSAHVRHDNRCVSTRRPLSFRLRHPCLYAPLPPTPAHPTDVNPNNILVRADGSVALSDFGLAVSISPDGEYVGDKCGGTMHFGAPEVAMRNEYIGGSIPWPFVEDYRRASGAEPPTPLPPLTRAVDIWSLGALAVCLMVTGTDWNLQDEYVRCGRALPAYVPEPMVELIRECTADVAALRPSAQQVLARLAAMQIHMPQFEAAADAVRAAAAAAAVQADAATEAGMQQLEQAMVDMLSL